MNGFLVQVLLKLNLIFIYIIMLIFPDKSIKAQSGNKAASESDVTPLGTRQGLNFDEDTLISKDCYNC